MAWRITVKGFPSRIKDAGQASEYLRTILSKDKVTSKMKKDWFDSKMRMSWETQAPEFCNGIGYYGKDWDMGKEYIMIRFVGHFPEAIVAFSKKGLQVTEGG